MRAKRFHKLTAWLLTLAMLMTFVPGFTFTAFAAGEEARWGASAESLTESGTFAEAVAAVNADGSTVGCIQLQSSVTSETGFEITRGSLTLDLNGKTIDVTYSPNALVFSGTELVIQDSGTGGTIRSSHRSMTGLLITGGAVELKSGTLDANEAVCIYGDSSSFTQSGGAVKGRITVMSGSCTLSGGTFSGDFIWHKGRLILEKPAGAERYRLTAMQTMPVSAVTLPEGWKLADKNESEFTGETIEPNGYVYVTACAASVTTSDNNTTYYLHLDEAVEAARDNYGSTVKLLRDVESYHPILIANASFTLDLNGKTITSDHSIFEILTYSFITLTDSSAEQSGRMTVNSQSESAILLYEAVQLTIKGGTVETLGSYAVDMSDDGRATNSWLMMEGGKLIGGHAAVNASGDRARISGGVLEHTRSTGVDIHYSHGDLELWEHEDPEGISVLNGSGADIKASDVRLPPYFVFYDEGGERVRYLASGGTYTIGRGIPLCDYEHDWRNRDGVCWRCEFVCKHDFNAEYVCVICGYTLPAVVTSAGGELTAYADLADAIAAASSLPGSTLAPREDITLDDEIVISSGDFIIDLAGRTIEHSGSVFDIKGDSEIVIIDTSAGKSGRVLGSSGSTSILIFDRASLTVSGSTIEGGLSTEAGDTKLIVKDGAKLISRSTALTVSGGSVTIENGSIECTAFNDIHVISGNLDLSGLQLPSGVTLRNGGEEAIPVSEIPLPSGYVFFDGDEKEETELIPAKPYTSVYTIRRDLPPCTDGGGKHDWKNRDGVCGKCDNAHVHEGDVHDPYTCYECGYIYPAAVTSGGSTTVYKTLDDALIFAVSHEDSTVTLRDDIREDRSYEITGGRFTIDLCGKTVIGSWTLYNDANVTIKDSSDDESGKLSSTETRYPAVVLMDDASLTVSSGTIEALSDNAIDMTMSDGENDNKSKFVMTGGKLIGLIKAGGGSATLSGGIIETDTVHIRYLAGTIDLSEYPDPTGIKVQNECGEEIYASECCILPEGYVFYNVEGNNPVRILEDRTLYPIGKLPVGIYVGEAALRDGQYLANGSSTPTDTMPEGGYAYYEDGVLTLHDYVYNGSGSDYTDMDGTYSTTVGSWGDLAINVEGTNSLTNLSDDSDAITVGEGDLTITGEGTLDVSATYGLYVYGGDVSIKGSTLNIETRLDGIYSGNNTVIEGGTVNITTGDVGINASNDITVSGGKLSVESDGDGLYAYAGDVTIDGGEVDIEAAVDGIYAYEGYVNILGGKTNAVAGGLGIDGVYVVMDDTDIIVAVKGEVAVSAADSLTLDEGLDIILPEGGSVGAKTVLNADGNAARAAYIVAKGLAEHSHQWAREYSFDAAHHFKPCVVQDCPLMNDPDLFRLITEEHDFDGDDTCTVCAFSLWSEYDIVIAGAGLHSGEYIDNDGNVTAVQPQGGYAYYKDGVLTLHDYIYSGKGYRYEDTYTAAIYYHGDLVIDLQGTNSLQNRTSGGEGVSIKAGSLTFGGSGSLAITAACGIYADGSSVTFSSGTINIEAIEVAVLTKNGDVTVGQSTFTAGAGYGGILTENGSVKIASGTVSISAGAIGISSHNGAIWIAPASGMRISVYNASSADGAAIEGSPFTSETDITGLLSGGSFYSIASNSPSYSGPIYYTVTFETNGGSAVSSKTVARNSKLAKPTEPTKDGYSFIGWFTDEELTTAYDFDARVTKSFTLYAGWAKDDDETDTPDPAPWENPFTDVKPDDWYYEDVKYVAENGLFNGGTESKFVPYGIITRGMLVTVLYRAEGEPEITGTATFEDVDENAYYAKAAAWAQANGIVKGYSETRFAPNDGITREQIATIIFRYAQYKEIAPTGAWAIRLDYADLADISDFAADGVMYCTLKGIMRGKGNNIFAPKDTATRAEAAAILHRFFEANE